jgi:predicted HTH domain antitoxin
MQLTIELPEEIAQAMRLPADEIPGRIKQELAIRLYAKGVLSFGKARELAGLSRWAFHDLLGDEGIERRYGPRELAEDLETLEGDPTHESSPFRH